MFEGGSAMLTRRKMAVLTGSGAACAAAGLSGRGAAAAVAAQTPIDFDVPRGACDCHLHVFPDPARFPFTPNRVYTPPVATAEDALELQRSLRLDRVVVIQPSVYGMDNGAVLDAIRRLGPERARGVAVIDADTPSARLDEMGQAGIRGVQVNLEIGGAVDPATSARRLQDAVRQVAGRGWHVQTLTRLATIDALKDQLMGLPVPLVVNHFGNVRAEGGVRQPGFASLLELVRAGKAYVKLSGAHHISNRAPDFPDPAPLAQALIQANPDRVLWGTNWPHPDSSGRRPAQEVSPFVAVDDGRLFNELPNWAPDAAVRRKILVDNPARLYGFG
jgi:predicted TIM-barrel fold metal-dependent hydrolase